MAATIARAIGRSKDRETEASRLGPESAEAQANTFRTFTTCKVEADGSGYMQLERQRDGKRIVVARIEFAEEGSHLWNVIDLKGVGTMVPNDATFADKEVARA